MGSLFSLGSAIVDIHMVKTRLGTGVPRSPESNAPISGGAEEGEEGSEEGGEEESEDSEEDVPLAQRKRKVARV